VGDRSQEHALSSAQAAIARPPSLSAAAQRDRVVSPAGVLKAIEDGAYHPTLKKRLTLLEGEKAAAAARLARSQSKLVLRLHPNLSVIYQRKVQQLTAALNEPDTAVEAVEIIRRVDRSDRADVVRRHFEGRTLRRPCGHHEPCPRRARRNGNVPGAAKPRTLLSVVAGVGFEPTTFRL
jgi:site-specific DNA recombinase